MSRLSPKAPPIFPAPNADEELNVYVVLEGGGAKGVAHVGALRAIENTNSPTERGFWPCLKIRGVAGSSVGAFIASFIAVGFRPDDLVDRNGNIKVVKRLEAGLGKDITSLDSLFRDGAERKIDRARALLYRRNGFWRVLRVLLLEATIYASLATGLLTLLVPLIIGILAFQLCQSWGQGTNSIASGVWTHGLTVLPDFAWAVVLAVGFAASLVVAGLEIVRRTLKGLLTTEDLAVALNAALKGKYIETLEGRRGDDLDYEALEAIKNELASDAASQLKFWHLSKINSHLRVVATNLEERRLELFSSETTPDTSVAEAVVASMAIPILFKDVRVGKCSYQDGGLISNIPAWAFHEMRSLESDAWVVAVSLEDDEETQRGLHVEFDRSKLTGSQRWQHPFRKLFQGTLYTAVFGGSAIETMPHDRLALFKIQTGIGTLDFDKLYDPKKSEVSREKLRLAVDFSEETARIWLGKFFCTSPAKYLRACDRIANLIKDFLDPTIFKSSEGRTIRVCICRSSMNAPYHRIQRARQYDLKIGDDNVITSQAADVLDDRVILPHDKSVVGEAHREGKPILRRSDDWPLSACVMGDRDRYRAAMMMAAFANPVWKVAIPVFVVSPPTATNVGLAEGEPFKSDFVVCVESDIPLDGVGLHLDLVFETLVEEIATELATDLGLWTRTHDNQAHAFLNFLRRAQ